MTRPVAREVHVELRRCLACGTEYMARRFEDGSWENGICPNRFARRRRPDKICGSDRYMIKKEWEAR